MTIDRLRETLGAVSGDPPDALELSEMLWLACHVASSSSGSAAAAPASPVSDEVVPPAVPQPVEPPPARAPEPRTALHPHPAPAAGPAPDAGSASEVLVPTAPMLPDPLGVQRALRPLKRRVPSRHRRELDEEATAARIADTRLWTPVLVPAPERWLTLTLVVDTGPTMRLWRPLARELAEVLVRQGAFHNVTVAHLDTAGRITAGGGAPPRAPGTLQDASGRHAVLVLSDCSGPHWWDGRAARAVRRWALNGPTAILQPLAERLWRRTAAPTAPGLAVLPRPGGPDTGLRFAPFDGGLASGVPVPVLEVSPRWFGAWARLVSGSGPQPTAVTFLPSRPSPSAPVRRERELPVAERVRRFLATASPDAAELAAHVAVSVPSLPVMRLIQHGVLGGSDPGRLAEVLLSGLLRPLDDVRYEFVPGAREALLDTLPRPEAQHTRRVLEAVSAEIERRAGGTAETFRALLPADGGPVTLTADTDHFALVRTGLPTPVRAPAPAAPNLLDLLDTPVDDLIGEGWNGPPRPTPIGVDTNGETVRLDVLRGAPDWPHGLIVGPRADRDRVLRTIVFSLALVSSPHMVTFAFADFSQDMSFVGLGGLPHVASAVHGTAARLLDLFLTALEDERIRREAAMAEEPAGEAFAALVVFIDSAEALLDERPELRESLVRLCEEGPAQGIRFVFCSSADADPLITPRWRITVPGPDGDGTASLLTSTDSTPTIFRHAIVTAAEGMRLTERMQDRGIRATRLPWPDEPNPDPQAPTDTLVSSEDDAMADVLALNGAGSPESFLNTWGMPRSTSRQPAIGYDVYDGSEVTLTALDLSMDISHGLVLGDMSERRHILRTLALALAARYSPRDVNFIFSGLAEHPLGEPLDLPHVQFSVGGLLARTEQAYEFIDLLSRELDRRSRHGEAGRLPRLVVMADVTPIAAGRPELSEMILSLMLEVAQLSRTHGIQMIIASRLENTAAWASFLPLLTWRIAANRLPSDESRLVLGRANLPLPGAGQAAYIAAGSDAPRPFMPAPLPRETAVDDFIDDATHAAQSIPYDLPLEKKVLRLRNCVREFEELADPSLRTTMLSLAAMEEAALPVDLDPRHTVFEGTYHPRMTEAARLYGRMLAKIGMLRHGNVSQAFWRDLHTSWPSISREAAGGILLIQDADEFSDATARAVVTNLVLRLSSTEQSEPVVAVLCGTSPRLRSLLAMEPGLGELFQRFVPFPEPTEEPAPGRPGSIARDELATVADDRVRIGVHVRTDEPVMLDFRRRPHLAVYGRAGTGKTTVLRIVVDALLRRSGTPLFVIDPFGGLREPALFGLDAHLSQPKTYAATSSQIRYLIRGLAATLGESTRDVFLVIDDQHVVEPALFAPLHPHIGRAGRLHLVIARAGVRTGDEPDPLLALGQPGFASLRMGVTGPDGQAVPGSGVLGQGADHVIVQVDRPD
ncbi:SAV_2336 N-terminal domain-related protein [Actinomadura opuntiae]|uniref:SAV_2336 N-terminal domain-related protein n=1 Tax=Actinomadura sp. OS1-43 TaxID=604315 RepID=UPI00255B3835|nr:SAV_2336 N-terminal domain-related protein [Actinomadura sp. OS1-43]MDL4817619.1 SAV_2336 N-terminal domain-related protein [Actinomadura sp. OS1-43]